VWGTYARTGLPTAVSSFTYNAANELTKIGNKSTTRDANGSLTSDGTTTYTWNNRGQLASSSKTGLNASYAYDAFARRRSKTIGAQTTGFLYDGQNVVQELSGSTPTANLLTGLRLDETYSRADSTGTKSLLTDVLGSTLALADTSGSVTTSYTYEPFGNATSSGAASTSSFQYTGRENDGTGLDYYRSRYYSPTQQRFISEDPIELAGGDPNLYAYVFNRPLGYVDPLGLCGSGFGGFMNAMLGRCGAWKDFREIVDDIIKTTIVGAAVGGAIGCGLGAISAIELGPPGMIGVCIVSGAAGIGVGAVGGAREVLPRYIGPLPIP
jgi:RHS repeat-associated protein